VANQKAILEVNGISKHFSSPEKHQLAVLNNISFSIEEGEVVAIIGPSGCGKTTLLRILSGLLKPSSGYVTVAGDEVTAPHHGIILVFQEYSKSLFPWATVEGNVQFGLEGVRLTTTSAKDAIHGILSLVGLADFAKEYPWRLSGGMQQRVALARALVRQPKVLLMDEPFGSLDAYTRYFLEDEVLSLAARLNITILLVTHDIDEAVYMSDRVLVLSRRPASIVSIEQVSLGRPRHQIETRSGVEFGRLRGELLRAVQWVDATHE